MSRSPSRRRKNEAPWSNTYIVTPVGVWRNLQVGINPHKGYPVIVAGGHKEADIQLTPENAVQIVRAAMKARVSLIVDLYSPSLANKSKWKKIVQESIDVLMYENEYGPIHIIVEEAAEFIPQRLMGNDAKVYSSIERVARMGRNANLGLTIINQRAEEVNKAILELCATIFLHKQVGKNSLSSIQKWLAHIGSTDNNGKSITSQLPQLQKGECFIIDTNTYKGGTILKSKILKKKTFHPTPETDTPGKVAKPTVDIKSFIKKLNNMLTDDSQKKAASATGTPYIAFPKNRVTPNKEVLELKRLNEQYSKQLESAHKEIGQLCEIITNIMSFAKTAKIHVDGIVATHVVKTSVREIKKQPASTLVNKEYAPIERPSRQPSSSDKMSGKDRMLKVLAFHGGITRDQLAVRCGISPNSGTYSNYLSELKRDGLITSENGLLDSTREGNQIAAQFPSVDTDADALVDKWIGIVGSESGMARILNVLHSEMTNSNDGWIDKQTLEQRAGMSHSSGTLSNYYSYLNKNKLIEKSKNSVRLSHNIYPRH